MKLPVVFALCCAFAWSVAGQSNICFLAEKASGTSTQSALAWGCSIGSPHDCSDFPPLTCSVKTLQPLKVEQFANNMTDMIPSIAKVFFNISSDADGISCFLNEAVLISGGSYHVFNGTDIGSDNTIIAALFAQDVDIGSLQVTFLMGASNTSANASCILNSVETCIDRVFLSVPQLTSSPPLTVAATFAVGDIYQTLSREELFGAGLALVVSVILWTTGICIEKQNRSKSVRFADLPNDPSDQMPRDGFPHKDQHGVVCYSSNKDCQIAPIISSKRSTGNYGIGIEVRIGSTLFFAKVPPAGQTYSSSYWLNAFKTRHPHVAHPLGVTHELKDLNDDMITTSSRHSRGNDRVSFLYEHIEHGLCMSNVCSQSQTIPYHSCTLLAWLRSTHNQGASKALISRRDSVKVRAMRQAALAVAFLHKLDLEHGNIAARNFIMEVSNLGASTSGFGKTELGSGDEQEQDDDDELEEDNEQREVEFSLKLCDTGARPHEPPIQSWARKKGPEASCPLRWAAPELLDANAPPCYTKATDIWSLGVTIWETFSDGKVPYEQFDSITELFDTRRKEATETKTISTTLDTPRCSRQVSGRVSTILKEIFVAEPKKRPSAAHIADFMN